MNNSDKPSYPTNIDYKGRKTNYLDGGLTKRERFALAAMQGICANPKAHIYRDKTAFESAAQDAVYHADALLKQLDK